MQINTCTERERERESEENSKWKHCCILRARILWQTVYYKEYTVLDSLQQ